MPLHQVKDYRQVVLSVVTTNLQRVRALMPCCCVIQRTRSLPTRISVTSSPLCMRGQPDSPLTSVRMALMCSSKASSLWRRGEFLVDFFQQCQELHFSWARSRTPEGAGTACSRLNLAFSLLAWYPLTQRGMLAHRVRVCPGR